MNCDINSFDHRYFEDPHHQAVISLKFLEVVTRPNIIFAINFASKLKKNQLKCF
jgi:hypothetical protein